MNVKILKEDENKLFGRIDVRFEVVHEGEATPKLVDIRHAVAEKLGGMTNATVIDSMNTLFGIGRSIGEARVYKKKEDMFDYEPEYLLKRNQLIEAPKKEEEETKEEAPKKEEKK